MEQSTQLAILVITAFLGSSGSRASRTCCTPLYERDKRHPRRGSWRAVAIALATHDVFTQTITE